MVKILTEVAQAGHRGWGPDCLHQRAEHMKILILIIAKMCFFLPQNLKTFEMSTVKTLPVQHK